MGSLDKKIVLVTGANTGIGYEIVKALLESSRSYHVYLCSRDLEKGKKAIERLRTESPNVTNTVELLQLDVTDDDSIQKAYEHVQSTQGRLDVLINNAGASYDFAFKDGKMTLRECFNKAYDTNLTGAHVVTYTFVPLLLKSSDPRLLFVAGLSMLTQAAEKYFPTPPLPAGWPKNVDFETIAYRCTKTALSMLMLDWNHKLKADGVKVWSVSPGLLLTDLGGGGYVREMLKERGAGPASEGGAIMKSVVEGEWDAYVGKIVSKDGIVPW